MISRDDMELFYQGMGKECVIPEVALSAPPFPTFDLESPFSIGNTVGIYSVLKINMDGDEESVSIVDWRDLTNLTSGVIEMFEWYRASNCSRMVRYPTAFSQGSDLLDDEVLKLISEFVEDHQGLVTLFDTRLPLIINILSPRAGVEALRIFTSHSDQILLEGQQGNVVLIKELESRVGAL